MTPRELAAAIRKGAQLRPQGAGQCFSGDGRSCALGAAWEGAGYEPFMACAEIVAEKLRIPESIWQEIIQRNDGQYQTREQIADWLDTLEPAPRQTFEQFMARTMEHVETELSAAQQQV